MIMYTKGRCAKDVGVDCRSDVAGLGGLIIFAEDGVKDDAPSIYTKEVRILTTRGTPPNAVQRDRSTYKPRQKGPRFLCPLAAFFPPNGSRLGCSLSQASSAK